MRTTKPFLKSCRKPATRCPTNPSTPYVLTDARSTTNSIFNLNPKSRKGKVFMKEIKELNTGDNKVVILFDDGSEFDHTVTPEELSEIQRGDRMYIENLIAKYMYRDSHSTVGVWRYLNNRNEVCASPSGKQCGQCKHFQQTGAYYSETSMGNPDPTNWPYPIGSCKKHGFGPCLSAYHSADGKGCGWEIADWCKLDDQLTKEQEKELRELWK